MKPQIEQRDLSVGGSMGGVSFGISKAQEAHVMAILRDTLYSDKILAVVREYSANAWDANRAAGRRDTPIEVHLPTADDLYFRVKDSGPGLSHSDVFEIYTQYGESTKRDSDDGVGMLGIGSKSAFAYADSFTVISRHGGKRSTYVAALDPTDRGVMNLLAEEDWDPADTGVEVVIAVEPGDVYAFEQRAHRLFRHFEPRPNINCRLAPPPDERVALASGEIHCTLDGTELVDAYGGGNWVAVMGCIPYNIRLSELNLPPEHQVLHKLSGVIRFDMGAVHFTGSREELRYTKRTKDALSAKFTSLVDEFVSKALEILDSDAETDWQKRLRTRVLLQLGLELPGPYEDLGGAWVKLFDQTDVDTEGNAGGPFRLVRNGSWTNQVTIDRNLRFLIDDAGGGRKIEGYRLAEYDYVVRHNNVKGKEVPTAAQVAELETVLADTLAACKLKSARVEKLSTLYYHEPWQKPSKDPVARAKHRATMFKLVPSIGGYCKPYSDHWEVVTRVPEATDVYVILDHFESGSFYSDYREDQHIAKILKITDQLPTAVYGYKTTEKKPVDRAKLTGVEYDTWRATWKKTLFTPELAEIAQSLYWQWAGGVTSGTRERLNEVVKNLGRKHPISMLIAKSRTAARKFRHKSGDYTRVVQNLADANGITSEKSEAEAHVNQILLTYPLLALSDNKIAELWARGWRDEYAKRHAAWTQYIKLVDRSTVDNIKEDCNATATVHAH